jgi:tetratricopeptide (TPR) repeat protein
VERWASPSTFRLSWPADPRVADRLARLLLTGAVLAVFSQTLTFPFVNFDDPLFVSANPQVRAGLTWEGVRWAFSDNGLSQYHPLTWLSYMLDWQLFGGHPWGFHAVNTGLHLASTLLLFGLLRRFGAGTLLAGSLALVFAVHPLRAESVAWIAERKDVLSACLGLACLGAYLRYAQQPCRRRYLPVVLLLALGLLAKPMLVTLPAILLLLDVWPLGRAPWRPADTPIETPPRSWGRLLAEKLPLLALAAASGVGTLLMSRAVKSSLLYPLAERLATALSALLWYLRTLVWPTGLAVYYPYDHTPSGTQVVAGFLALAGITGMALAGWRRRPWLAVGWLWFLVMLLPVSGLLQAGDQRYADRYTYLSHVGLLVALGWQASQWLVGASRRIRVGVGIAVGMAATAIGVLGWQQTRVFASSISLWRQALAVTTDNAMAHHNLALALAERGDTAEAERHLRDALAINPGWPISHFALASLEEATDRWDEALQHWQAGLAGSPADPEAHFRLGLLLARLGRRDEAMAHLRSAASLDPDNTAYQDALRARMTSPP